MTMIRQTHEQHKTVWINTHVIDTHVVWLSDEFWATTENFGYIFTLPSSYHKIMHAPMLVYISLAR